MRANLRLPAIPADQIIICQACGTPLAAGNFAPGQLKKRHPVCRACAPNKFGNQKTAAGASKRESARGAYLAQLERAGVIRDLRAQVKYELLPAQYAPDGKFLERSCSYVADFVYIDCSTNALHVEDSKGMRTEVYKVKRKMMLHFHKIRIEEV